MLTQENLHEKHKKHRNFLYTIVIILLIFQIITFTVLTLQVSNLNTQMIQDIKETQDELKEFTTNLVETYDSLYQQNFNELTQALLQQGEEQATFQQEIKLLKSVRDDFSGIVEDTVRSVVTVRSDNSIGTGFIVDSRGYIVTNYHVVDKSDSIQIITYDRNSFLAELIGKDINRDLALLKIQDDNHQSIPLANSNNLQVGNKVIAIGNPLGLSFTVTEGIVSGVRRTGPNGLNEYIQTDVSLNPGNSGGPLINTRGEVVGINNFKIGGSEGLGFALESNSIKESINDIANKTLIS
jgi:S1-C subfamily serine protease